MDQFAQTRVSAVPGAATPIQVFNTAFNQYLNIADQNTNGVDVEAKLRIPQTGFGDLTFAYQGTYIFEQAQKVTYIPGQNWQSTVGTYAVFGPVQRYRHYLSGTWMSGPWTVTLGNNYSSGYEDEYTNADGSIHKVGPWGTWDLYGRWTGVKNLALVAGITNLFNNQPPVTNQQSYFQIGYDPTVVNPLGRVYYGVGHGYYNAGRTEDATSAFAKSVESEVTPDALVQLDWVVPGRFLAGEHPGSQSRAEAMDRLRRCLACGVTCFIDLTEPGEFPSYEALLPYTTADGRRVEYLREPIHDHDVPASDAVVTRAIE